ncbi:MAG TPA: TrkA family potassium uptake protein [Symbiobacteriaceae bacterium]|nr:TrkA family potassium uptake protein [Symbiobacteriaceae bacterium]
MEKRFAVIGLGRFGASVAQVLHDEGAHVVGVDHSTDTVDELAPLISRTVRADSTNPSALKALRIDSFDTVIVAIGDNVEASVITCLNCRDLGVKHLVAKAQDEAHGRILERLGVDRVVYPQRDMGARVAANLSAGRIMDFIRLSEEFGMAELEATSRMIGQSLAQLDMSKHFGLNVVAIKRGADVIASPGAATRITAGDVLVVIGSSAGIDQLQE